MRSLAVALILVFINFYSIAQSLTDLQDRKQKAAKEIEYTFQLISQVKKEKQVSLNRLRLINSSLNQRNVLIINLRQELMIYEELINDNELVVRLLTHDINRIKKEYAELIRSAYLHKNVTDELMFLISAENFNQAYRRFLYMRHYASYRKQQAKIITAIQVLLRNKIEQIRQLKEKKQQLIDETLMENSNLFVEQTQQNEVVNKLQQRQKELRRILTKQRNIESQLENEIERIIIEEAKKNRKAGKPAFALTPEQKLIGDSFEQNKKRLPWPVERGIITEHFGIHQHPVLNNVKVRNNGITIGTETGAKVRAVFKGEVSRVFGITGGNTAVIVRHGKYLSVYSNLREVIVKKGDKVAVKQPIGTIFTDFNEGSKSILKFQIWRENQKLDPEEWIGK